MTKFNVDKRCLGEDRAPNVEQCERYDVDLKATIVESPTGSSKVVVALGLYGVQDPKG